MTLTPNQLAALRTDLTTLVQLDYDHLRDELLDHYATLTEENMANGLSFYEASTTAWVAMGNGEGIQRIQTRYELVTRKQIKARHAAIMKSFLYWPTVVTTLLTATLVVYLLFILPVRPARLFTIILVCSPLFVMVATAIPYYGHRDSRKKLVWNYIVHRGNLPINVLNMLNICSITDAEAILHPSRLNVLLVVALAGASLFLTFSLAQLMREHFTFKLAQG